MRVPTALCTLGLTWLAACGKHAHSEKRVPSARAGESVVASASAAPVNLVPHLIQPKPGCRALEVQGDARADDAPIGVGTLLDGEHWVKLEANARVSIRHTLTSRELTLIGPGLMLPCRHGKEEFLLANGKLSSSSNLGVRPGAEVLIASPSGSIHFGDAAVDVEFGPKGLRLRVKEGEAWLEPGDPSALSAKNPLRSPKEAALPAKEIDASALANACQTAAETAADSARRVLGVGAPKAPDSLGARAAAQLRDRAAARARCAMAAAAAGSATDPATRQSLWASIAHSDELWQSVPRAVSTQKN